MRNPEEICQNCKHFHPSERDPEAGHCRSQPQFYAKSNKAWCSWYLPPPDKAIPSYLTKGLQQKTIAKIQSKIDNLPKEIDAEDILEDIADLWGINLW